MGFHNFFGNGHWPYPSIHTQEGEVGGACSSSEYSIYGSMWITFLHPYLKRWPWTCFCPWIIFERPILEANRGRLDVRDVLATCEMGIRLLVKAMKRWFWNGNKSGRKSDGEGDYNIKAGAHHKRLPQGWISVWPMRQITVDILTLWHLTCHFNLFSRPHNWSLFVRMKIRRDMCCLFEEAGHSVWWRVRQNYGACFLICAP